MIAQNEPQSSSKIKKTLSLALVAILAATLVLPMNLQSAYAEPTSAEKQAEVDEVSAALAVSEQENVRLGEDYRAAVEAHEEATALMNEAQGRIDAAEAIIGETQERLGVRANQMYKDGPLSFLNVLFGASSFEEFTTSWDLINAINQENAELIQANKEAREEAQAAHDEYSLQEQAAAERKTEAEALMVKGEELAAEQQALLSGLTAEVAALVEAEQAARLAAEAAAVVESPTYTPPANVTPAVPVPEGGYSDVVAAAVSRLGCPYVYGATGPSTFDCSGLTSWCYAQAGRGSIGRTDSAQYAKGIKLGLYSEGNAQPGDVLWWTGHVAIYVGGGSYIHAPVPGQVVSYSSWNINSAIVLRF